MDEPQEKPRPPTPEEPAPRDDVVVGQNRCPFCRDDVRGPTTDWVACAACLARHHEPCWGEGGGRCAACGHGERLRLDSAPTAKPPSPRALLAAIFALVLLALFMLGGLIWLAAQAHDVAEAAQSAAERVRAEREEQEVQLARERRAREEQAALLSRERERARARELEREAAQHARRAPADDSRFAIARRVDELRRSNPSFSRIGERDARRRVAWQKARLDLALARTGAGPEEAARFDAALKAIDRLDPPPGDGRSPWVREEHGEVIMPPLPDHPEFVPFVAKMRGYGARSELRRASAGRDR